MLPDCPICAGELRERPELAGPDRAGAVPGTFDVVACDRCGTGYTTPPAAEEELPAFYGDSYGPHAVSRANAVFARVATRFRLKTRLFRRMGPGDGRSLLDVGSGRGEILAELSRMAWDVVGLEPSPQAAEYASRQLGVPTIAGTLASAGDRLEPGSFDVVLFHHSLEHVVDPVGDLERAATLLKPDGRVMIAVPNFGSRAARGRGRDWWALDLPRHRTHFTSAGLTRALAKAGFNPRLVAARASVLGPVANEWHRRRGAFNPTGLEFLASYGAAVGYFPAAWAQNALRGDGEFLTAIARV